MTKPIQYLKGICLAHAVNMLSNIFVGVKFHTPRQLSTPELFSNPTELLAPQQARLSPPRKLGATALLKVTNHAEHERG